MAKRQGCNIIKNINSVNFLEKTSGRLQTQKGKCDESKSLHLN